MENQSLAKVAVLHLPNRPSPGPQVPKRHAIEHDAKRRNPAGTVRRRWPTCAAAINAAPAKSVTRGAPIAARVGRPLDDARTRPGPMQHQTSRMPHDLVEWSDHLDVVTGVF